MNQLSCESPLTLSSICLKTIASQLILCNVTRSRYITRTFKPYLPISFIKSIYKIVKNNSIKINSTYSKPKKHKLPVKENLILNLLNNFDFTVQSITEVWEKITEVFINEPESEQYLISKRIKTD